MRCRRSRWTMSTIALAFVAVSAMPRDAHATDSATAQALFDQGRKLMAQERWAEACPKLEESQRLDPAGGTLLHLALCREHEGRIATAWAIYQDALAQAKHDGRKDRAKIAQERIDSLTPRLPRMRIRVATPNRRAPGFTLSRDETGVGEAQWGEPLPVDPGTHLLTAKATGRKSWNVRIEVPSKPQEIVVDVPELEVDPQSEGGLKPEPTRPGPSRLEDAKVGDVQRTTGIVIAGLGGAGIAVGAIFGLVSISKNNDADKECKPPDHTSCTAKGIEDGNSAKTSGNISTVAFIAGAALVAGGLVVYFTAPRGSTSVAVLPSFGPHGASLGLSGSF